MRILFVLNVYSAPDLRSEPIHPFTHSIINVCLFSAYSQTRLADEKYICILYMICSNENEKQKKKRNRIYQTLLNTFRILFLFKFCVANQRKEN